MANKAFGIQGADLTLGGVNLQAGATSIVIPGVTQATNYFVEEVDETGEQTNTLNLPIVIDNVTHTAKVADAGASVVAYATYSAQLDGDDYIEELDVNTAGTYVGSEVDRNADFDMWGYTGSDAEGYLTNWVTGDWVQIPFRPKMRAGEVENVGGGGGLVERAVVFPGGATGDIAGILASDSGTLYYSTGDYTDVNDIDKQFEVDNTDDFDVSQTGGTSNSIRILAADYSGLKDILDTLNNAEEDYQTDFTVDGGGDFGGAQVVTQVSYNGTTIDFLWPHRTGVDPTSILQGETFTVEYIGTIPQPAIWTRILASDITTDVSKYTTELTVANKDFELRTTRNNPGQDADIGLYSADDIWIEAQGDDIELTAANEIKIRTNDANNTNEWIFNASGHVQFPDGSVQVTAYTGTGDDNIWIETFASDAPSTDFVQGATSVEYDADGNVIALFSHYEPGPDSSYTSVAKLTPTGAVLWQVRFGANLYSDGWGLAYDGSDSVYVAGRTSGTPLTYEFATLTKIDAFDGTIVWSKTYDFEANSTSAVVDVDSDLNPVMVGYSYNGTDTYIVTTKIDQADGTVVWSKTLDGQGNDEAYGMAVGPSNEIVTIGYTDRLGAIDAAATLYTDPVSNANWTSTLNSISVDGLTADFEFVAGVPTFTNVVDLTGGRLLDATLITVDGAQLGGVSGVDDMIVKVGTLAANDTDDRMVVVKYATDGTIAWQKAVQFDTGYDCRGADADIDSAGNIYVCGSYQYDYQTYTTSAMSLVKFNSSGVKQWSRRVVGNCDTFGTSVVVGDDDQLYLSGITGTDNTDDYTWVVAKYNTDGVVTWQRLIDNTTTWTFGGSFWFGGGGGSNIAVKNGYVALAGAFGDPGTQPIAVVVQIDTDATPFSVGDWDIKGATFSGLLDASASDITVVNANKPVATVSPAVGTFASGEDTSNFLTITRYGLAGGDDSLVNGAYTVTLGNTGTVTLPAGGTITEGYITSNPTIQLTPASPTVVSQKLVIKGGGLYTYTDNGIEINYNNNTAIVGDTLTFYVYSNTYPDQTLYWWIYPQGAGIGDTESGTVVLTGNSGMFSILIDSDDYEFTVRVSPEADNYDPANVGVETGLINADAPTFDSEHHLHLTTGNLAETSIFLGTDDHNVRTTVNGGIEITTPNTTNNVWQFGTDGKLTLPGNIDSVNSIGIQAGDAVNITSNNTGAAKTWNFNEDGDLTLPAGGAIVGAGSAQVGSSLVIATNSDGLLTAWGPTSLSVTYNADILSTYIAGSTITFQNGDVRTVTAVENYTSYIDISWNSSTTSTPAFPITLKTSNFVAAEPITARITAMGKQWTFTENGNLTLPGAVVNSTVAKTGADLTANDVFFLVAEVNGLGEVTQATVVNGPNPLWVTNTGGLALGDVDFSVNFDGSGNATVIINSSGPGHTTVETWELPASAVGATAPTPTALDLTKTVNKLTNGVYTLADGVEGQIMYLVRQAGAIATSIIVQVANARVNSGAYTTYDHYPFDLGPGNTVDIDTLIFTDGAWQADGGSWD